MIEIKDIQAAVAGVLQKNGYSVVSASEVQEGFERPVCFIEVLPVSVTLENQVHGACDRGRGDFTYHPAIGNA